MKVLSSSLSLSPSSSFRLFACHCCLIIIVLLFGGGKETNAQYPDDEVCHWRCDIISCDYYQDYCDYDCYEDCYSFRSSSTFYPKSTGHHHSNSKEPSEMQPLIEFAQIKQSHKIENHKNHRHLPRKTVIYTNPSQAATAERVNPGKVVRLRMMNPMLQVVRNGRIEMTKVSPTKEFALFESQLLKK